MKSTTLYVSNIPYSTSSQELQDLYAPFNGTEARVIPNKGYGFVDIPSENADAAIEATDNKEFQGRHIRVAVARPRSQR